MAGIRTYTIQRWLAEADWIVGINATRALTSKYITSYPGRVQTPTLAMILPEEEIRNFKPKTYYGITAVAQGIKFTCLG